MNPPGEADPLFVLSRATLLDALVALEQHRDSVIVVGAQAVYLRAGAAQVAVAETTKDSDLGIDTRTLGRSPLIEDALKRGGFEPDPMVKQPGAWISPNGIPLDLMVAASAVPGNRGARVPPHNPQAMRRAAGLEAAVVDNNALTISALASDDRRRVTARVASAASLVVAKMHKISDRERQPDRLSDKDAHDVYRLLVAVPTLELASSFRLLLANDLAGAVTRASLATLDRLFASGPSALGSRMAGRAEEGLGDPDFVAASSAALASDLLASLAMQGPAHSLKRGHKPGTNDPPFGR